MLWNREPAQYGALIAALIVVAVGFGLPITDGQVDAIQAFTVAVASVAVALSVRPLQVSVFQQLTKTGVALLVVFGVDVPAELQTALLAGLETAFNFALRPSVTPRANA